MRYGRDYDRNFLERAARSVRGWVGAGRDYDEGYRGRSAPLGRGPETNWNGRNYRDPGQPHREYRPAQPRRGYDASFGAGYQPRHGAWEVEWPEAGYDRGYAGRPARGYDRGYTRDVGGRYDRGYREMGGMDRGRGGVDRWGPYSPYRMLQSRSSHWGGDAWPNRYFTDHGHNVGPY
jgi:hypothetical protein